MRTRFLILSLILVCIGSAPSQAMNIPALLNHQSLLTDSADVLLNGIFTLPIESMRDTTQPIRWLGHPARGA